MTKEEYPFSLEEWETCLKVLQELKEDPYNNPDNELFGGLITKISKKAKKLKNPHKESVFPRREELKQQDFETIKETIISKNAIENKTLYNDYFQNGDFTTLNYSKNCYCCNQEFKLLHYFYNRLCPECATENYDYRFKTTDLKNRNVIITGGRVKIGLATALKFLRANANVTITTRFPASALEIYQKEEDYEEWKHRLDIYGLDLRNLQALDHFIQYYISKNQALDILVNNAAQTIKYDINFYTPLIQKENLLIEKFKDSKLFIENKTPVLEETALLETSINTSGELTRFGQPVDKRMKTSWNSTLEEISTYELLEVNLINQISPYFLIQKLTPLLENSKFEKRFIINVTSSEGIFSYNNKTMFHPHTNMTKASLNMLTRTSGIEYIEKNIYMNAVDVGWVSTGAVEPLRKKQFEIGYIPPLDSVDGAARILHPIIDILENNSNIAGVMLKNYKIAEW
ncbi:SDR family NAD(P)-dependent oxidoreductase [Aureivirga marina]|uniref:SDR family NAD(P)-dependent oxidoreductase n=1 Tax=Aureivirga marina TaxID=1182451 RepID=UPI0018CA1FD6|nr:SDR family oxidoreductase [Aureivirga marina]